MTRIQMPAFLLGCLLVLGHPSSLYGQDETELTPQELIAESIKTKQEVYQPLQLELNRPLQEYSQRISMEQNLIHRIKNRDEGTLDETRERVASLRRQLKEWERLEDTLLQLEMDPESADEVIKTAENRIIELNEQRNELSQPFQQEIGLMHQEYSEKSKALKALLEPLAYESGTTEATSGLTRSHVQATFCYASAIFAYSFEKQSALQIDISFPVARKINIERFGQVAGKYPIQSKSDRNLSFQVGNCDVRVYARKQRWEKDNLETAVLALIDLEKLEEIFPAPAPK